MQDSCETENVEPRKITNLPSKIFKEAIAKYKFMFALPLTSLNHFPPQIDLIFRANSFHPQSEYFAVQTSLGGLN